jgi:hypothetical protein
VYTDAEVGLSLKYPPDWRLTPGRYIDTSKNFYEIRFDRSYVPIYRGITVLVEENPKRLETRAFIQQWSGKDTKLHFATQDISVAGLPAVKVLGMPGIGNMAVFVSRGFRIYRFALEEGQDGVAVKPQNEAVFYQILRTVSFE